MEQGSEGNAETFVKMEPLPETTCELCGKDRKEEEFPAGVENLRSVSKYGKGH